MSAIKPWGKAALIGLSPGSLALGIGFRTRETLAHIVDPHADPTFERLNKNRCVLTENTVRLLVDLGTTQTNLLRILRPARKWKFVTAAGLDTMRDGDNYANAAPNEPCFHVAEGELTRMLRRDYLRFGGVVEWEAQCQSAFDSRDETGLWSLKKEFGTLTELHMIGNFAAEYSHTFNEEIFDTRFRIPTLAFNSTRGWTDHPSIELTNALGSDYDLMMALGREVAMNVWRYSDTAVAWQLVSQAPAGDAAQSHERRVKKAVEEFHPALRALMATPNTEKVAPHHDMIRIPLERPRFQWEDPTIGPQTPPHRRRSAAMGDTVIPVDAFGWRGDHVAHAISEASQMCSRLFATSRKFHRGDMSVELRQFELDCLQRRFSLATGRDLRDAETLLAVNPELPREDDEEPEPAHISV